MLSAMKRWWIGGLAFVAPLLVAVGMDVLGSSQMSSGASAAVGLELFAASVVFAAGATAFLAITAPTPPGRRLGLLAVLWAMLLVEGYCTTLWMLRGMD